MNKIFIIWMLSILSLSANVIFGDDTKKLDNFIMEYHLDTSSSNIDTIKNMDFKETNNKFTFGYVAGNIWFKLTISNQSDNQEFILILNEPYFDEVNMFKFDTNIGWEKEESGLSKYFKDNNTKYINPKFKLKIDTNSTQTIYFQLLSRDYGKNFSFGELEIYTQDSYISSSNLSDNFIYIFYFGTLFFIFIFNLFLFFSIRKTIYFYYAGYVFFNALFVLSYSGLQYDIGLAHLKDEFAAPVILITIFFLLFSMEFLNTKKYLPKVDLFLKYTLLLSSPSITLIILSFDPWFDIMNTVITIFSPILIFSAFYIFIKGYAQIKLYLIALVLYVLSMLILSLMVQGWISNSDINHYSFLFISYIEILVFSFVLSKQFDDIQKEIITIKDKNEKVLEREVKEQTFEIRGLLKERELLLKEIYHRVKNNFQMIVSLLWIKANQEENSIYKNSFLELINRIQSMSSVHQYLLDSNSVSQIKSDEYLLLVVQEIEKIYTQEKEFKINKYIDSHILNTDEAVSLAIIINEIITNSIKHYSSNTICIVDVILKMYNNRLLLIISDNGNGFDINQASKTSFGLNMIKEFAKKLDSYQMEFTFENGTTFELSYAK